MERSKYPPAKRPCKRCQELFTPVWRQSRFYCSAACRDAGPPLLKMARFERVYPPRDCKVCGEAFTPVNARQIYCQRACYLKGTRALRLIDVLIRHSA